MRHSPVDMTDQASFDDYRSDRNLGAARLVALLVALLMPSGVVLDWFTHREQIAWLFAMRMAAALAAGLTLWMTYAKSARRHTFVLGLLPILAAAIALEVMIESLEGYSSPYYAGLTHCLFGLGVIFYWRIREILLACTLVVATWLVPTLAAYKTVEAGPFANNFFALGIAAAIAVASNGSRFRAVQREHAARSELERALDRLKELDQAKNQFFANVSHELRTPLTLILAPLAELLDGGRPEDRPLLAIIQRNAARLMRHIEELLDLSRLDAGRLRLNVAEVKLGALLTAQIESSGAASAAAGLELSIDAPRPVNDVWGDANRIDTILTNLVSNALKFTPSGGRIVLRLSEGDDHALVEVSDTGPGIAADDLARVFDRFYQVEVDERRRQEGAGIGLALSKELADLHGGSLTVRSRLGQGTTFALRLRKGRGHFSPDVIERRQAFRPQTELERRHELRRPLPGLSRVEPVEFASTTFSEPVVFADGRRPRVLLVEDHADLRWLIRRVLEPSYDISETSDGQEALAWIRQHSPDLVVSDVMMPNLSGTELCRVLKSEPALKTIPVILLTARVGSEATMDAYAHGADDFVSKPFHPRVLFARITAQLRLRAFALQIVAQEKIAVIGTLAAGVAHEVRNPLNAMSGACQVLLNQAPDPKKREQLLRVAIDAASRIETIVAALDAHARPAEADGIRPYDLREGIDATLRLLELRVDGVRIHRDYATERDALVRPASVNQVVLNLIDNAVKAGAANVWIRVAEEQDRITVAVEDDGHGVAPQIVNRIFDPFFTTREPGSGTGLGLHLSRQIIAEHGGHLRHAGRDGGGARFAFDLPAS
jgi:signal transduction histidine kinase